MPELPLGFSFFRSIPNAPSQQQRVTVMTSKSYAVRDRFSLILNDQIHDGESVFPESFSINSTETKQFTFFVSELFIKQTEEETSSKKK